MKRRTRASFSEVTCYVKLWEYFTYQACLYICMRHHKEIGSLLWEMVSPSAMDREMFTQE